MTYDRLLRERFKAPLYRAREETEVGSREMANLFRDHRALKLALDEQLKRQKR